MIRIGVFALAAIPSGASILTQSPARDPAILVDGHVDMTNRVYWEGIDPWTPQPVGQRDTHELVSPA